MTASLSDLMIRRRPLSRLLTVSVLFGLLAPTWALAAETPWSRIQTTAPGRPSAIGGPSNGCVRGAEALAAEGQGYVSIRRHRNRYYGHPETLALVQTLGRAMERRNGRLVMIGDLAQPRGGRMSSSHRSHQNGLDVDVWLTLADDPSSARRSAPEGRDPPSMVTADGLALTQRWGPDQLFLLRTAAEDPRVDRIFVNAAIKRGLCRDPAVRRDGRGWLRKLRPWWGHDAHFHVRLRCPADSPDCSPQAPVPAGDGCDASLDWWLSAEARSPKKGSSSKPSAAPPTPAACRALMTGL
jgi:penicillin-insensitive murein endopeptidase